MKLADDLDRARAFAERELGRPLTDQQLARFMAAVEASNRAAFMAGKRTHKIGSPPLPPENVIVRDEGLVCSIDGRGNDLVLAWRATDQVAWKSGDGEERLMGVLSWAAMIAAYLLAAGFILALVAQWWSAH